MSAPHYDILLIGNALVDVLTYTEEDFLIRENLQKSSMHLIEEVRAQDLTEKISSVERAAGGSAANTAVGVASFGLKAGYIGKVAADSFGQIFLQSLQDKNVTPLVENYTGPTATGRCFVYITPDRERTMATYLGASHYLVADNIPQEIVQNSTILYLEGYLWDVPAAQEAMIKAARIARSAGRRVALTLSDSFCVDRRRSEFLHFMQSKMVDILFANENEIKSLYQTSDLDRAISAARTSFCGPIDPSFLKPDSVSWPLLKGREREERNCESLVVVTRGELGALILTAQEILPIPAHPIRQLIDMTGAGDLFAAGFLTGLIQGADYRRCGELGALAAAEIIQHLNAHPEVNLQQLAAEKELLCLAS